MKRRFYVFGILLILILAFTSVLASMGGSNYIHHAAGMLDTMGLLLTMSGLAIYAVHEFTGANFLSALKIVLIVVFIFITSPTATHAIVDAGVRAGLKPWKKGEEVES